MLTNAGWIVSDHEILILDQHGDLNYCIPLKMLLGITDDYTHILMNVK